MLSRVSIRTRLVLLSIILLMVTIGTNLYLTRILERASQAALESDRLIRLIESGNEVRTAIEELRYWQADLAVSLLTLSERNAQTARKRVADTIARLSIERPAVAQRLRTEVAAYDQAAMQAVDAYTNDRRVIGNALFGQARQHVLRIDELLAGLDTELNAKGMMARDDVLANASRATRVTIAVVAGAILLGLLLTVVILRSILQPLRALVTAIEAIRGGDLTASIPPRSHDEIGEMSRALGLFRDSLGEREHLAHEAEHQRRTLQDAIACINEGFVLYDADDLLVLRNAKYLELYPGLADGIQPGTPFRRILELAVERGLVELGDQPPADWIAERLHHRAAPVGTLEYRFGERWVRIGERRTYDGGAVAVYTDITELKQRQRSLELAMANAERANQVKSEFLANMSHELRTPLNAIIGFSEIISGQFFGEVGNARYLDYSYDILRSGRHLLTVINDVLDLSKSEAGKMILSMGQLDMRTVLTDCVAMVREQCSEAGHTLVVPDLNREYPFNGDAAKLRQIFLNLLSNAIKFTEAGGTISLGIQESAEAVAVTVSDTGIGMNPEDVEIAFKPFAQVDNRLERRYEGTGLGLPLTKALVDLHKGSIVIDSARGKGTRITVSFPRAISEELQEAV